jgi:hypothetical protein
MTFSAPSHYFFENAMLCAAAAFVHLHKRGKGAYLKPVPF